MPRSRAAILDGRQPRHLEVRTFDVPELGPEGELVLRTLLCGICGSDLHRYNWTTDRPPTILGHEILGIVERAPAHWRDAAGNPLAVGDLVVPETRIPCHRCAYCRGVGSRPQKLLDYSHCPYQRGLGGIPLDETPLLSGGWSDYVELPDGAIVHHLPPTLAPEEAVLLEPFSIGMKAARLAGINGDDTVIVLGPGPIGLLAVVACHDAGAKRIILAGATADEQRLALGRELGADATVDVTQGDPIARVQELNHGRLATRVIEATGTIPAVELGIALLDRGGVLVTVGGHKGDARASFSPGALAGRQIDIRGTQLGANYYEACIDVLAEGRYPFARMITHRFALSAVDEAMRTFEQRGACIKPVIAFD
jgi:threonine dehydrogenase-like Zn-dependent dehydrogenase